MVNMKRSRMPGEPVAHTIRFSQKDFQRGVDEILTFRPLREAVSTLSNYAIKSKGSDGGVKTGRDVAKTGSGSFSAKSKR